MTIHLAANLSLLFDAQVPWPQRCARVAAAGFGFVEILFPYDQPATHYKQWLDAAGLQAVLINTPVADHRGLAAVDGAQTQFRHDLDQALACADTLGVNLIHVMAGCAQGSMTVSLATLLHNLEYALRRVEGSGVVLTLEALNRHDVPGYFYHHPAQVVAVLNALPSAQLRQQFDFYHTQREGLDLIAQWQSCRAGTAHVQIAQAPTRCEPKVQHGELRGALQVLVNSGYAGYIGCEYTPQGAFEAGLHWLAPLQSMIRPHAAHA